VVQTGGGLGGYRWGVERKRELLEAESEARRQGTTPPDDRAPGLAAHGE
jgi:6-O-methylguanine DNA methyltransferase, DNA binding domain